MFLRHAIASLGTVIWFATRPGSGPKPQAFVQLTDNPGEELYPSIAADGKFFAFSGANAVYVGTVEGQSPLRKIGGSARILALARDGTRLAAVQPGGRDH